MDKEATRITLRLPSDIHSQLVREAELDVRSLNGEIIHLLRLALAGRANRPYSVSFTWDDKDAAYLVDVPSLPGCLTYGKTLRDAFTNATEAIELTLSVMRDRDEATPPELRSL